MPVVKRAVKGGACNLICLVSEGGQSGKKVRQDSGLVGDQDDIKLYLHSIMGQEHSKAGFYYRLCNPLVEVKNNSAVSPCKIYLDFDFKNLTDWREAWTIVKKTITVVSARITSEAATADVESNMAVAVAFGERGNKHSFHVTFPYHGFESPMQLGAWLEEYVGCYELPYDRTTYGRHQLMRGCWCGKEGDIDAVLKPHDFFKDDNGVWQKECAAEHFDGDYFDAFNINFYDNERDIVMVHEHNVETKTKGVKIRDTVPLEAGNILCARDAYSIEMMEFFEPLFPHIRKKIQEHRQGICRMVRAGGVPTHTTGSPPVLKPCNDDDSRLGIFHYKIDGDMFCEYDTPTHLHTNGQDKITIQVNLIKGTYNQLCHACRPSGHEIRYYSLFTQDDIDIRLYRAGVSVETLELSKDDFHNTFIRYFSDDLIYNPLLCENVIVYDNDTKLWVYSMKTKQNLLMKKKNLMKKRYVGYITARYMATVAGRRRRADAKEKARIVKEGKGLGKVPAFVDIKNFADIIADNCQNLTHVKQMDAYPELVPLQDGQCFNIFTGKLQPMLKHHYFTSCLNGVYAECDEEDIEFINTWLTDIASGRVSLATYHKRLSGLVTSFIKLDRKFYSNVAPAGSNGKSVYRKMLKLIMTDPTQHGQNRFTNLNNKFFSLRANNNASAGCARPEWLKMRHKSCFLVEELPAEKTDVEILKLIASMDEYEARGLYQNQVMDIQIQGRLIINSNYPPQLGDTKPIWNRAVFIPWDTTYVENQRDVDKAKFKLPMNEQFINILKTKKNAFIRVILDAIHLYLKPHVKPDGTLGISELERPKAVTDFTELHRAKHMSVEIFTTRYMRPITDNGELPSNCNQAYTAYRKFLRDQGNADVDYITFYDKLTVHNIATHKQDEMDVFTDLVLNEEGIGLLDAPQYARGTIERGFEDQTKRRRTLVPDYEAPNLPPVYTSTQLITGDEEIEEQPHIKETSCILNPQHCNGNHIHIQDLEIANF